MNVTLLERDTHIENWSTGFTDLGTVETGQSSTSPSVLSDGALHPEYATLTMMGNVTLHTAAKQKAVGVHLTGPADGNGYTPYQISCVAMSDSVIVRPVLCIGLSPATITADTTGDVVTFSRILAVPNAHQAEASCLQKEIIFVANVKTATRGMCVLVNFIAGAAGAANVACYVNLSVRRLLGVAPLILDTRKT